MPERSAITQGVQIGLESTPGTAVPANKELQSIGIGAGVEVEMQRFRPMGNKFATIITPGKEWVEAPVEGVGSYSELVYLFSSLLTEDTPAVSETTANTWDFVPASKAEDTVKTYTVEQGGTVRAHEFSHGILTELELTFNRDAIEVSGSMLGQELTDDITLTVSPTAIEEKPILPTEVDIFLDTTSGGLGGTKLTRVLEAKWSVGDRFNPVWVLNSAEPSFVTTVESEPSAQITLMLEADAAGMALLTAMRAGATRYIRIACTSPDLAGDTSVPYSMTLDSAAKVSEVGEFSDEDGIYAIEWTFDIVHDPSWSSGQALSAQVVNKVTAL